MFGYGKERERSFRLFNPFDFRFAGYTLQCCISVVIYAAWVTFGLAPYVSAFGFQRLLVHYLIPVIIGLSWFVFVTFLHHVEEDIPWYSDDRKGLNTRMWRQITLGN